MLAAVYCRLSKEDTALLGCEEVVQESESIQNQRALLTEYAAEQGWQIYDIYCDEDYSGIDRERPAFCRLLADAEQRRFDVILCKTQSRFTRDMELVEHYIHNRFVVWGIRFVAVVDNIDTDVQGNKKARQINGLINEWYLEDLSENIKAVFRHKRNTGQYIGGFPVYGYQKSSTDKNRLMIDEQAAEVVRKVFSLYLAGNGKQQIASMLNAWGVPNPTKYKQSKGWNYVNGAQRSDLGLWSKTSVGRILKNQMYTGDLVQGTRKKISYKSKNLVTVPKEDWVIVPDTHEAIIDRETFSAVAALLGERTRSDGSGSVHLLAGKVRCMDCGSSMLKVTNGAAGSERCYLRCKLYATDKSRCSNHSIRLDRLEKLVSEQLQRYIQLGYVPNYSKLLEDADEGDKHRASLQKQISILQVEARRRDKALQDLYLDKSAGVIGAEQFTQLSKAYLTEKAKLQEQQQLLIEEADKAEDKTDKTVLCTRVQSWLCFDTAPRELVVDCIDTIEIGARDPQTNEQYIRINWLL
ncbi:recombinase family protein [Hydrogenoanaerobacterium sp.]|uniref:recombinase family protein n=1 Tax=Hydrogenoanaerobacterium sp. TaxID=2953763 RepID=UPI002898DE70|nr:recombinase family protein [Hydrogenoanaerobacterium sp.]